MLLLLSATYDTMYTTIPIVELRRLLGSLLALQPCTLWPRISCWHKAS